MTEDEGKRNVLSGSVHVYTHMYNKRKVMHVDNVFEVFISSFLLVLNFYMYAKRAGWLPGMHVQYMYTQCSTCSTSTVFIFFKTLVF